MAASLRTARSLVEMAESAAFYFGEKEIDPAALPNARRAKQPEKFRPQLATLLEEPPGGREWLHEVKFDGYRAGPARFIIQHGGPSGIAWFDTP